MTQKSLLEGQRESHLLAIDDGIGQEVGNRLHEQRLGLTVDELVVRANAGDELHEPLIEETTFERVQDVLRAHMASGDRCCSYRIVERAGD